MSNGQDSTSALTLRELAVKQQLGSGFAAPLDPALHELRRQLEARTEELRQTKLALEKSRHRNLELYEFSPLSYLTLADGGVIIGANLAAAMLLGQERGDLLQRPFDSFVVPEQRADARRQLAGLAENEELASFELTLNSSDDRGCRVQVSGKRMAQEGRAATVWLTLIDITRQASTEDALLHLRADMRALAVTSSLVREQEKRRVARELHDELGQAMTALKMDITWIARHLTTGQEPLVEKLNRMEVTLNRTVASMRRIAANLRPLILDDLGFLAAAESLVENFREHSEIDCQIMIADASLNLPEPYATEIFRILQESLTNIAKHAHASLVEISIGLDNENFTMTVSDNGRGFDVHDQQKSEAFGLLGLRERAYLMGGEISIISAPNQGTSVNLRMPISKLGIVK